jgi:hypothetical protein
LSIGLEAFLRLDRGSFLEALLVYCACVRTVDIAVKQATRE